MASEITIDRLFDDKRFPAELNWVFVVLYFPLGLMLTAIRFFIGIHIYTIACFLPKVSLIRCFVLRVMCGVLGLIVVQHDLNRESSGSPVLVSNYTTPFDHVAVELARPNVMPSVWDLPNILIWLLGYRDMGAKHGRETLIQNASRHCRESSVPLLAFPEGATTNGKIGLLKFSVWPFSLDQPVQPVAIKINRPLIGVTSSVTNSKWWNDLFWFLFVPFSVFHIRYLPVMTQNDDETPQEFAKRVQVAMADSLGIVPTAFTSIDKLEYIKRQLFEQQSSSGHTGHRSTGQSAAVSQPSESDLMINQVKIVLPHVPVDAIRRDLALTKDIDLTITNILEGRVTFTAEESAVEADRASSPCFNSVSRQSLVQSTQKSNVNSPVTFPKNPQDRQRTFEERKKELLDTARQRYITKHGPSN